jgi:membrane fusion protein, multidrug efflux system
VVRIAQDGPRDIVFSVPEDKVAAIKTGSVVAIRSWSDNKRFEGKVREVAASADPVTRTFAIKVSLDESQAPALGTTVYVLPQALSMAGTPVIKLPTSALRQEGKGTAVWVLDSKTMTVRSQPVQIATADGNEAVIASGLAPGMQVVAAGVHVLSPGQKVAIWHERSALPPNDVAAN